MVWFVKPCAGLDPAAREHFLQFLQRLGKSKNAPTLVLVTHHVEEIMPVFSHVLILKAGCVLAAGKKSAVLNSKKSFRRVCGADAITPDGKPPQAGGHSQTARDDVIDSVWRLLAIYRSSLETTRLAATPLNLILSRPPAFWAGGRAARNRSATTVTSRRRRCLAGFLGMAI
jgi:ABC-type multidrug transport system ATPase subunit